VKRLARHRYLPLFATSVVVLLASVFAAWALRDRTLQIDRLLYAQCVANEQQDTVIVAQLRAARSRARASLPPGSPVLEAQLQILNDGINTLEPPREPDCQSPKGTDP
jgi:hypothetical protein